MIQMTRSLSISLATLMAGVLVLGCSLLPGGENNAELLHHVNLGSSEDMTVNEQNWKSTQSSEDRPWTVEGGDVVSYDDSFKVKGTDLNKMYQTGLEGLSSISFDVPEGTYVLRLHFAETNPGVKEAGKRVFDVAVEDVTVLSDFDPFASAGGHRTAAIRTIDNVLVKDGSLDISFKEKKGSSLLHGISVYSK